MLLLKFTLLLTFLYSWLRLKNNSEIFLTNLFFVSFVFIFLPFFFFNPSAISEWSRLSFTADEILKGELLIASFLLISAAYCYVRSKFSSENIAKRMLVPAKLKRHLFLNAFFVSVVFLGVLLISDEFQKFRVFTFRYIFGLVEAVEYREYRHHIFSGSVVLDGLLGRLRYTVFPIIFLIICKNFIDKGLYLFGISVGLVFFLILPMSLSKFPFFYYFMVLIVYIWFYKKRVLPSIFQILISALLALVVIVLGLSFLYKLQYVGNVGYDLFYQKPLSLAVDRIWSESYSIILRYISVYPEKLPYAGWSGVGYFASIFSDVQRFPDIEVAQAVLGLDSGSNPGVFFLGGYAAFGYAGFLVYVIFALMILTGLEMLAGALKTDYVYEIAVPIMIMNVFFLMQVSLQTTFISYGLLVAPFILFILDRWLALMILRSCTGNKAYKDNQ